MQADPHAATPTGARSYGPAATFGTPVQPAAIAEGGTAGHGAPIFADPLAHSHPQGPGAAFATGAYQPSGNVYIDRMLQLEQALKLNAVSW